MTYCPNRRPQGIPKVRADGRKMALCSKCGKFFGVLKSGRLRMHAPVVKT